MTKEARTRLVKAWEALWPNGIPQEHYQFAIDLMEVAAAKEAPKEPEAPRESGTKTTKPQLASKVATQNDWMTVQEAAKELGLTAGGATYLVRAGRISGKKQNGTWRVDRGSLNTYKKGR